MKNFRTALFLGVLFYVAFLVATLPAAFINVALAHYGGKRLQMTDVQGTIWQGSGNLYGMESLHWKIGVPDLLLGHISVRILSNKAALPITVVISPSRIEMKQVELLLPAALLPDFLPPLRPMAPDGLLHVSADAFTVSNTFFGKVSIEWLNAASSLSRVAPLGSYHGRIAAHGHRLDIRLDTLNGPLFLAGKGYWSRRSGLHFAGSAHSSNEQLAGLLNLMGKPDTTGACPIHIGTGP